MIVLDLPMPPSSNGMFYNRKAKGRRGRGITAEYRAWRDNAGWAIRQAWLAGQRPGKIKGPVSIEILLAETMRGDASNRIKAVEDLLVAHEVIESDDKSIVKRTSVGFAADVTGAQVRITPWAP